jgi:hypothetical protein
MFTVQKNSRPYEEATAGSSSNMHRSLLEPWVFSSDALIYERCVSRLSSNKPIFLPRHLVPCHHIKQGFMYFWSFLNFLEFKSHGTQCLCPSRDTNMSEKFFQFTAQDINTQGHKYDFSTNDGLLLHVHVVQIWIMAIIWLESQLMS